jgi:hypothetical protein
MPMRMQQRRVHAVPTAGVVHQNHGSNCDTPENIKRIQSGIHSDGIVFTPFFLFCLL